MYLCKLIKSVKMKRKIDTTIQFSGLKSGSYDYSYALDGTFFSEFENDEILDGSVNFEVKLEKKERVMMFHFAFRGAIETKCDRCLGDLVVPVEGNELLCVKLEDEVGDSDNNNEDVAILSSSEHSIDLAQWMYEYVVVAMPFQKLHAEGECDPEVVKYIREEDEEGDDERKEDAEGEGTVDPRWEALLKLKK